MEEQCCNEYRLTNITESEVSVILNKSKELINKELKLIESSKEDNNIRTGKYVDRLLGHEKNREFLNITNMEAEEVLNLAHMLTTKYFCHYEPDTKRNNEPMYCFKLPSNIDDEDLEDDILVKFKFRPDNTVPNQLFLMSFHFPDPTKQPWTHLY